MTAIMTKFTWAYEHDLIMTSGSDFHEKEDLAHGGNHYQARNKNRRTAYKNTIIRQL